VHHSFAFDTGSNEAATPINSVPYTISAPGIYYLAKDIFSSANAKITISANNVLFDLGGHTLQVSAIGECILVEGINVTVQNGTLINNIGGGIFLNAHTSVIDHIVATSAAACAFYDQEGEYPSGTNNRISNCVFLSGNDVSSGPVTPRGPALYTVFFFGGGDLFENNIVTSIRPGVPAIYSANTGPVNSSFGNAIRGNIVRVPAGTIDIDMDEFDTYSGNLFPGQPPGNANVAGGVPATE
jgi:hypothetical protein